MAVIRTSPSLTDQVYQAILNEICAGALRPGSHLVQEQLAERLGVSRQPIQQAMALLKADGVVEEVGKRGLAVARLDLALMRHHYDIRAALDGFAARAAAQRAAADARVARSIERRGNTILALGEAAVAQGAVAKQIEHDEAFHNLVYGASGNPLLTRTAEPHWRFLRRAMGDVLRHAEPPSAIWSQHAQILQAIVAGDAVLAEQRAVAHIHLAATLLAKNMASGDGDDTDHATTPGHPATGEPAALYRAKQALAQVGDKP